MRVIVRFRNVSLIIVDFLFLHALSIIKYALLNLTTVIFVNFGLSVEFSLIKETDEAVTCIQIGRGELSCIAMQLSSLKLAFLDPQDFAEVGREIGLVCNVLNDSAVAVHCAGNIAH